MHPAHRTRLALVLALIFGIALVPILASQAAAASPSGSTWSSNCSVKLRTGPRTTAAVAQVIDRGAQVTATTTVSGGSWAADCGTSVRGSTWLRIVAVGGRSVSSLYGVSAVYAASGLFRSVTTATVSKSYLSNCSVRLRGSASTRASTKAIIATNTGVTTGGVVGGSAWSADCRSAVRGSTWYRITAVGGRSVKSLYGVSVVYAATGLFRVGATSNFLQGVDVSSWQGTIDWAAVRSAGIRFAFAKATEGVGFEDTAYDRNQAGAMSNGIAFGAYHFARPENDPVAEADWFVDTAHYRRGMLVPVLDLERTGGRSPAALATWVKTWLARVQSRLGVAPMIYASPTFWGSAMGNTRWFADNGYAMLWVAHWSVGAPSVPASNWGGRSWTFWQYTSSGSVPGIPGRVDLNRFRFSSFASVSY